MLNKIKKAIDEIGYTNKNIDNKEKGLVTFFIEGEFNNPDIDNEMHEMVKDMDDVCFFDTEIASIENRDALEGCYVTFQACDETGMGISDEKKKFKELKAGDTLYEHCGCHVANRVITKITDLKTTYGSHKIEYIGYAGIKKEAQVLGGETSIFPFFTSIDEIVDMTKVLVSDLEMEVV